MFSNLTGLEFLDSSVDKRILIIGGYGAHNIGDEAILMGILSQLPKNMYVKVVSLSPEETALSYGVDAISPLAVSKALFWADVLIIGGGGLFSRHMGFYQRFIPLYGLLASSKGIKVALVGIGVYPSTPRWVLQTLKWLANRSVVVTVRDKFSLKTLQNLGVKAFLTRDFSEFVRSDPSEIGRKILNSLGVKENKPVIGLSLTAIEKTLRKKILQEFPKVIEDLPEFQFIFIPMSQHAKNIHHNDVILAKELKKLTSRLLVLEDYLSPSAILALYSQLDAVVGMRYHSILFAIKMGVPLIPISYAEKCVDLIEQHKLRLVELRAEDIILSLREIIK